MVAASAVLMLTLSAAKALPAMSRERTSDCSRMANFFMALAPFEVWIPFRPACLEVRWKRALQQDLDASVGGDSLRIPPGPGHRRIRPCNAGEGHGIAWEKSDMPAAVQSPSPWAA